MARLKFDLKPVDRGQENRARSREEHDTWVREIWLTWEREGEPTTCDCGFYGDDWLVSCDPKDRRRCRSGVEKRLESYYRNRHLQALAQKRKFPEQPPAGKAVCRWCRGPIVHGKAAVRTSHDGRKDEPDCRHQYYLHTRVDVQQGHLIDRDGAGCVTCGKVEGKWELVWSCQEHRVEAWSFDGPTSVIQWKTYLEVDHFVPLAAAFPCFPDNDRRRWFFGPGNLQLLCGDCHKAKTKNDTAFIRAIGKNGPDWGKAEIIHLLAQSGRLKTEKPL